MFKSFRSLVNKTKITLPAFNYKIVNHNTMTHVVFSINSRMNDSNAKLKTFLLTKFINFHFVNRTIERKKILNFMDDSFRK